MSGPEPVPGALPGQMPREARVEAIRRRLVAALAPSFLEIVDDSHRHAGHAGARDGRGHFTVRIASPVFDGMSRLGRHRAVYEALGEMMQTDIHALSIDIVADAAAGPSG